MSHFFFDVVLAARSARRHPGATALVVASLALTIGVSAGIFSVLDAAIWRALPVRDPSQLVTIYAKDRQQRLSELTWMEYEAIGRDAAALFDVFAQTRHVATVRSEDRTEVPLIAYVSDNYFDALGVAASSGSVFHRGAGRDGEIVISRRFWQRTLGGDPTVVGRRLRVNDADLQVVGVLPGGFSGANRGLAVDLFVPIQTALGVLGLHSLFDQRNNDFELLGRLKPAATLDRAKQDVEVVLRRLDQEGIAPESGRTARVERLDGADDPRTAAGSALFAAIVLLVLLVAAANVANMRLAQNEERRGEISVRSALGASRGALWRQHLCEMLLLTGLGTAFACFVAWWLIDLAPAMLFGGERFVDFHIGFDLRTFAFSLIAMLLVTLVGTILPVREASKVAVAPNVLARSTTRRSRWLPVLVVAQIAFVTGIVCVAGLLWQSLQNVSTIRPAMDPDRSLVIVNGWWDSGARAAERSGPLAQSLSELPGVRRVAFARRALLSGSGGGAQIPVDMPGEAGLSFHYNQVSPAYFPTTGARVVRGRPFTDADGPQAAKVLMVNEAFVRRFYGNGRDPIGTWVYAAGENRQVVGIVEDGPTNHLKEAIEPYLYLPFAQRQPAIDVTFLVETAVDPSDMIAAVRKRLTTSDHSYVPFEILTMGEHMGAARREETLTATLAGGLAGLGLVLAAAGLFGVTLFAVGYRTREFGIRVALGATSAALGRQVVRESLTLVAVGLALGTGLAYGGHRLVQQELYGVSAWDPTSWTIAVIIVVATSLAATLQPAWRASRVDPIIALRQE
jgi:predicted permease